MCHLRMLIWRSAPVWIFSEATLTYLMLENKETITPVLRGHLIIRHFICDWLRHVVSLCRTNILQNALKRCLHYLRSTLGGHLSLITNMVSYWYDGRSRQVLLYSYFANSVDPLISIVGGVGIKLVKCCLFPMCCWEN